MDVFEKFELLTEEEKLLVLKEVERLYELAANKDRQFAFDA